jgi:hypothetical protein
MGRDRRIDPVEIPPADVPDDMPLSDYLWHEDARIFPPGVLARLTGGLLNSKYKTVGDLRRADDNYLIGCVNGLGRITVRCMRQRLGYAEPEPMWTDRRPVPMHVELQKLRGEVKALRDVIAMMVASRPAASECPAPQPPAAKPPASDDDTPRQT